MMLLTLIASPMIEDELIDWLLLNPEIDGFTTHVTHGHGSGHAMSLAEEVSGHRQQISFYVQLPVQVAESVINGLKHSFSGSGLHYWLAPITAAGSL